jgi:DNA polymerase V
MNVSIFSRSARFKGQLIPLFLDRISAGFPSPAQDYIERTLDLNELCVKNPAATFFVRVQGDSMIDVGIYPNDVLSVDRSLKAVHGDTVIACLDAEMTLKELALKPTMRLIPRNSAYEPIDVSDGSDLEIFGVVTNVIRTLRR